jgi:hypothetical protein
MALAERRSGFLPCRSDVSLLTTMIWLISISWRLSTAASWRSSGPRASRSYAAPRASGARIVGRTSGTVGSSEVPASSYRLLWPSKLIRRQRWPIAELGQQSVYSPEHLTFGSQQFILQVGEGLHRQGERQGHKALWHRLLARPASESGRLRHGDGAHRRGERRRRAFVSTTFYVVSGDVAKEVP